MYFYTDYCYWYICKNVMLVYAFLDVCCVVLTDNQLVTFPWLL